MSEHIKTGEEISHQFLFISQYKKGVFEKLLEEKWVSLSYVYELLKKYRDDSYSIEQTLLEEEK